MQSKAAKFGLGAALVGVVSMAIGAQMAQPEAQQQVHKTATERAGNSQEAQPVGKPVAALPAFNVEQPFVDERTAMKQFVDEFTARVGLLPVRMFPAQGGLTGIAYESKSGGNGLFYVLPDRSLVLAGQILSPSGENLSQAHYSESFPEPETPSVNLSDAFGQIDPTNLVTVDKGSATTIYKFYEPNCGFCMRSYEFLKDMDVNVHYIPVSFLSPESDPMIAAMYGEKNKVEVLDAFFERTPKRQELINAYRDAGRSDETKARIAANKAVMAAFGVTGTPAFFWQKENGDIEIHRGFLPKAQFEALLENAR